MTAKLPNVIATYQEAHDRRDSSTAIRAFADDATVIDDGHTYTGTEQIRAWLDRTANAFTYTRTLVSVEDHGDGRYTVHNHLAGNFPGGEVDLRYRFQLHGDLIRRLGIAP